MRRVSVVPILARATNWRQSACKNLKILPSNELPVAQWASSEQAYENIRSGLARLVPKLTFSLPVQTHPRLFQARDLSTGYVPRTKVFEKIKRLLLKQQDGQTIAFHGGGGFGKTTLALALCHDPEIQVAFPDGIFWMELGEQPPKALDLLNSLLDSLEESYSGAITLEQAKGRWRTALSERTCLLVIDDVWQSAALEPLLEDGPHCVRLITTRNDQVLPEKAERVWVDAMEVAESITTLCQGLPSEIGQTKYQPELEALVKLLVQPGGNSGGGCGRMKGEKEARRLPTCLIHKQTCFT